MFMQREASNEYCAVPLESEQEQNVWSESPIDFDSGNKGESAVFCNDCNKEVSDE